VVIIFVLLNSKSCVVQVLHIIFQDSGRPEIPKQYFSFADVSVTVLFIVADIINYFSLDYGPKTGHKIILISNMSDLDVDNFL